MSRNTVIEVAEWTLQAIYGYFVRVEFEFTPEGLRHAAHAYRVVEEHPLERTDTTQVLNVVEICRDPVRLGETPASRLEHVCTVYGISRLTALRDLREALAKDNHAAPTLATAKRCPVCGRVGGGLDCDECGAGLEEEVVG